MVHRYGAVHIVHRLVFRDEIIRYDNNSIHAGSSRDVKEQADDSNLHC